MLFIYGKKEYVVIYTSIGVKSLRDVILRKINYQPDHALIRSFYILAFFLYFRWFLLTENKIDPIPFLNDCFRPFVLLP